MFSDFLSQDESQSRLDKALDFIKKWYSKVDFKTLGPIGFGKKEGRGKIVQFCLKGGEKRILKKDCLGFLKDFTDRILCSLGPRAEDITAEDRDTIQEQRQRLAEAEKQQGEAEATAAEREKELQEMQNLR